MLPFRFKWITSALLAVACIGLVWWKFGIKEKPASPPTSGGPAAHSARLQSLADLKKQHANERALQQFARADLRNGRQRDLVAPWLLDPARTPAELRSSASVDPNHNPSFSNTLLTTEATKSGGELAVQDREALEIINAWTSDPSFQPVKEHLQSMVARLNGFVGVPPIPHRLEP